ncbi:MAG TPA: DUF5675 family protein [Flavisolibacter sp.]|jgi:hypothetical protein|nr:DUF5675 family protein [Flavisolibacter sp.]
MKLELIRRYHPNGTNGELFFIGGFICYTIELPWIHNEHQRSCIPEGGYRIIKRYSPKFGWHLHLTDVPGRELILIHPANNALQELKGCIAPVSFITGEGKGGESRKALQRLIELVFPKLAGEETILITIKSEYL